MVIYYSDDGDFIDIAKLIHKRKLEDAKLQEIKNEAERKRQEEINRLTQNTKEEPKGL